MLEKAARSRRRAARAGAPLSGGEEIDTAEGREAGRRRGELEQIASAGLKAKLWMHVRPHFLAPGSGLGLEFALTLVQHDCTHGAAVGQSRRLDY